MSVDISISHALPKLTEAMLRAPRVVMREVDKAVGRAANELAREGKNRAPKADSLLTNSIRARKLSLAEWVAGTDQAYAAAVEDGSKPGGLPPLKTMIEWIKRKRIVSRDPKMTQEDLAQAIRRKIVTRGIPAQPYMKPALTALEPRIQQLLDEGTQRGIAEALKP